MNTANWDEGRSAWTGYPAAKRTIAVEQFVAEYMPDVSPYRDDGGLLWIDSSLLHHAGLLPDEDHYGPPDRTVVTRHFEALRASKEEQ